MSTAIVTGASRGLGRALALDLARDRWDLVIDARSAGPLQEVARELQAAGGTVRALAGDIADPAHRRALVEAAEERGPLDLLVANAGTLGPSPLPSLAELSLADLEVTLRVNTVAQVGLVQQALPALRAAGGTVVAVTSDAAVEGYEGWGAYGASKAALEQLAHILGAEEPALRVYRFDPGDMRTRMHQDAFPGDDISDRPEPETVLPVLRRLLAERPPSGRYRAADRAGATT
ncbi:SDR family NAD(P)-dependent oxidoreductase [Iamia sp.]|uniref:SDR family NAD(P)-dependent oxidoreductase n=1 Tax=Iamia sp. TaxID=2722710 RepID=UPI002BDE498F|nr:SDR family NAD(P)-dependent oxidoreductase [Iamia sp.]HXH59148.1 SDR family NAD(P)-dependent oxidoreductase [Iamia sp.]